MDTIKVGGLAEIGTIAREAMIKCEDIECMIKYVRETKSIVPMFFILAGMEENQGYVLTKGLEGIEDVR